MPAIGTHHRRPSTGSALAWVRAMQSEQGYGNPMVLKVASTQHAARLDQCACACSLAGVLFCLDNVIIWMDI